MKVLMTGSTGFIGRAMTAYLADAGIEVARISARASRPGVTHVDFTDVEAVARVLRQVGPSHVLHLSGALAAACHAHLLRANAGDAAVLLDAAALAAPEARLLLMGSAAEYGPLPPGHGPVDERQPAAPGTPYGAAKLAQTRLALASGRPVVVVRPTNVVGPGMPGALALGRFAAELDTAPRRGEAGAVHSMAVGDLSAVRDLIDVRDAVRTIWALATCDAALGEIVNVGTGAGATIGEALDLMIRAYDRRVEVLRDDDRGGSDRSRGASAFVARIDKLEGFLGAQRFIPLADTMERMARSAEGVC